MEVGVARMMSEDKIRSLLSDIENAYEVGYSRDDLESECEKYAQIVILRWILDE
jgi:hypothetical protein